MLQEVQKNGEFFNNDLNSWTTELTSLKNVILTPHIGGSTEEAQSAIGVEVATAVTSYVNEGSSIGAVNFPEVTLRGLDLDNADSVRVLYIHKNVPGVLKTVNDILSSYNIEKQFSDSRGDVAYLMADISGVDSSDIEKLYEHLEQTPYKIVTRLLY
ncbi:unnamed protein product [[Candida] boidinii]|uniref:2-oxoglutarate reductase n=1 Tax=Candida boidinii TaxID=5477 RepID=A0A9W6T8M9_CANBO|nr:unnamed protein product [[Candida] boidinii]